MVPPHARLNDLGVKGRKSYYRFIRDQCHRVGKGMRGLDPTLSNLDELVVNAGWQDDWMEDAHYMTDKEKKEQLKSVPSLGGKAIGRVAPIYRFGHLRKKRCPQSNTFVYELYTSNGTWKQIGAPDED